MPIQHLTPEAANQLLQQDKDAVLIDVRSIPEYEAGHPEPALNIPLLNRGPVGMTPNPEFIPIAERALDKGKKILVSCQVGGRSLKACMFLEQKGFTDLYNVVGGFGGGQHPETGEPVTGWRDAGLPVSTENSPGKTYASLQNK